MQHSWNLILVKIYCFTVFRYRMPCPFACKEKDTDIKKKNHTLCNCTWGYMSFKCYLQTCRFNQSPKAEVQFYLQSSKSIGNLVMRRICFRLEINIDVLYKLTYILVLVTFLWTASTGYYLHYISWLGRHCKQYIICPALTVPLWKVTKCFHKFSIWYCHLCIAIPGLNNLVWQHQVVWWFQ